MADRAILRNLCAFENIAAVETYPFCAFVAAKQLAVLIKLRHTLKALSVGAFDGGDVFKVLRYLRKALLARGLRKIFINLAARAGRRW